MQLARSILSGALSYAQNRNHQQLTLSLMQTLQPWDVTTDIDPLPLTQSDKAVLENFWRTFFDTRELEFEQIKTRALLVTAAVHSADLGKAHEGLANKKCADLTHALLKFMLRTPQDPPAPDPAPLPQPTAEVITLPVIYIEREPPLATKKPLVYEGPKLVTPPPRR